MRRPRRPVANDHRVHVHGLDILGRVDEGLPLRHAAAGGRKLDGIRPEAFGGERKAIAGACGVFEEQVGQGFAGKDAELGPAIVRRRLKSGSRIENAGDLSGAKTFQIEQMAAFPDRGKMREVGGESAHELLDDSNQPATVWGAGRNPFSGIRLAGIIDKGQRSEDDGDDSERVGLQ